MSILGCNGQWNIQLWIIYTLIHYDANSLRVAASDKCSQRGTNQKPMFSQNEKKKTGLEKAVQGRSF